MYLYRNGRRELTRDVVRRLVAEGLTLAEIARQLGLTKSTVAYHFRRLGIAPNERFAYRYDWEAIQRAYDSGLSMSECAAQFGFNKSSWCQAILREDVVPRPREAPIEELCVAGKKRGRENLKRRLIEAGLKENCCEECGINDWREKPLSMALHHINGDGADNRLENIPLLCPNCNAQTPNYGGKNGHRRKLLPRDRLPAPGRAGG